MGEEIKFRHTMPVQIRFSDVDQFGHVNNSVYFSLYDLAKTTYIKDVLGSADWNKMAIVVANINANFYAPVFFSDHLVIETAVVQLGHKSFTLLQRAVTTDTQEETELLNLFFTCYLLDLCTQTTQLFIQILISTLNIIDIVHDSDAFCSQSCDHQCRTCTQIQIGRAHV